MQYVGAAVLVFYLMAPYLQEKLTTFFWNHHRFGQTPFITALQAVKFYKIYLKFVASWIGLSILLAAVVGLVVAISMSLGGSSINNIQQSGAGSFFASFGFFGYVPLVILLLGVLLAKAYLKTRIRNYVIDATKLGEDISLFSELQVLALFKIYVTNTLALIFTLGFAYPWTTIRLQKYLLETVTVVGDFDGYFSQVGAEKSAIGEEAGEIFDMDLDLGL